MENTSGYFPMLHKVLVKHIVPDICKGPIALHPDLEARENHGQVHAIFIAAGPEALKDQRNSVLPQPGDHVIIAKQSGFFIDGVDGETYRLINDLELVAIKAN